MTDIYSIRNRHLNSDFSDVYRYNFIPEKLKIQILYIASDILGNGSPDEVDEYNSTNYDIFSSDDEWKSVEARLMREWGKSTVRPFGFSSLSKYILHRHAELEFILDFCEIILRLCKKKLRSYRKIDYNDAVKELNTRFSQSSIGYQYDNDKIIRIDNHLVHKEIVKPALKFLSAPLFSKADSDYRLAHEHYREHKIKDCIIACGRAFESTMKAICDDKRWPYNNGARATDLITALRENGLFQDGADKSFNTYVAMLKTGVPDLRNAVGGHGEASDALPPPLFMASYALHMTATNILFLAEAWKASL